MVPSILRLAKMRPMATRPWRSMVADSNICGEARLKCHEARRVEEHTHDGEVIRVRVPIPVEADKDSQDWVMHSVARCVRVARRVVAWWSVSRARVPLGNAGGWTH